MNEFSAKRLGEILAFVDVGLETCNKIKPAFESTLGAERLSEIVSLSKTHKDAIHTIADRAKILQTVLNKLESKGDVLRKERDEFLDSKQGDSFKTLEWLGYFEGKTLIHASMMTGIAIEMGHAELEAFANSYYTYHRELFENIVNLIHDISRNKTRS